MLAQWIFHYKPIHAETIELMGKLGRVKLKAILMGHIIAALGLKVLIELEHRIQIRGANHLRKIVAAEAAKEVNGLKVGMGANNWIMIE